MMITPSLFVVHLYLTLLLTVSLTLPSIHAQPCGSTQNCNPNLQYPYRFCQNGGAVVRCSNNPTNEPGLTPYRVPLPTCAKLINGDGDPISSRMEDTDQKRFDVNIPDDCISVVNQAVDRWNCLCGHTASNASMTQCCVPVRWSNNAADFAGSPVTTLGIMYSTLDPSTCQPTCVNGVLETRPNGAPVILLNNTQEFTQFNPASGLVQRSLYSGAERPSGPGGFPLAAGFAVFSMRDVLTHEVGYWLGMRHTDEAPFCYPGTSKTGIMTARTPANRDPRELSDQDKCQFMKLYCPLTTSVTWEDVIRPSTEKNVLVLRAHGGTATVTGVTCEQSSIRAFTVDGRALGMLASYFDPTERILSIDVRSIESGVVALVLSCKDTSTVLRRMFFIDQGDR